MSLTLPVGAHSMQQARDALGLLRNGGMRSAWTSLRTRLMSRTRSFGLRRDLDVPFSVPAAKVAVEVRPLGPDDDLSCVAAEPGLEGGAAWGRFSQRRLLALELPTCWVGTDAAGKVCYMQWLVPASQNARVRSQWGGLFPTLQANEALLEGAYTAESHRGLGIMAHAMARIAEQAKALGARYVITFVDHDNVPSLKGCERAGFAPYIERRQNWTLFRRSVRFVPLTPT